MTGALIPLRHPLLARNLVGGHHMPAVIRTLFKRQEWQRCREASSTPQVPDNWPGYGALGRRRRCLIRSGVRTRGPH